MNFQNCAKANKYYQKISSRDQNQLINFEDKMPQNQKYQNRKKQYIDVQFNILLNQNKLNYYKKIYALISISISLLLLFNYQQFRIHCSFKTQQQCLKKFILPNVKYWFFLIIFDCLILVFQIYIFLLNKTWRILSCFGILQIFFLYIFSDQTISRTYYIGAANFLHISFLCFSIFIISLFLIFRWFYVKDFRLFLLIVFLSVNIVGYILRRSCDDWKKGITGQIQDQQNLCKVIVPGICWYKILNGYLDLGILFKNCFLGTEGKQTFNHYFSQSIKDGPFIGFHNINNLTEQQRYDDEIQYNVFKYAKGFKTYQEAKNHQEKFDVIFNSENQTYIIDIQRNETLIKQRKKLWQNANKQKSPPLAKNILFLYVDALGRSSMHIKINKTVQWFQKRSKIQSYNRQSTNKKQLNQQSQEAYQFYRYHSIQTYTQPNQQALLYGYLSLKNQLYSLQTQHQNLNNKQKYEAITQNFKKRGFITGTTNTFCQTSSGNFLPLYAQKFKSPRFDHQSHTFACDPNFQNPQNIFSNMQGPYSGGKRCLYHKLLSQYATQYTYDFFQKYKDMPKFYVTHLLEGHQGTSDGARRLDKPLSDLLNKLTQKQLLDDTVILLISDHGLHMQGLMYALGVQSFFIEINLPGLLILLPKKLNRQYSKLIGRNQQKVINAFNIHHFLKHILQGVDYKNKNLSLLGDLQNQNSCQSVKILDQFCSCKMEN